MRLGEGVARELAILVLAAGKGVRMKSDLPKVMHTTCGKPMLGWVLEAAQGLKPSRTIVIVGHNKKMVMSAFEQDHLAWVAQKEQLGTAHAVMSAAPELKDFTGDVMVLFGDVPLVREQTLQDMLKEHRAQRAACTILNAEVDKPDGYGRIVRDKDGKVRAIVEHRDAKTKQRTIREINSGIMVFEAKALFETIWKIKSNNDQGEFYLTDIVALLIKKRRKVAAIVVGDEKEIIGVNSRVQLAEVNKALRMRILEQLMLDGVTILDPDNTYVEAGVEIGRDTVVWPYTVIESGAVVGKNCEVGPFAHLRVGAVMKNGAEVGNFTEMKKATLGKKSKAKHLSYLGDVKIGAGVNIGAGTIVANYDGTNKFVTVIEDDAFVGSGSILVAPVKIGKGATTGAGAVVTRDHDVPSGGVVVGVPAKPLKKKKTARTSKNKKTENKR